VVNREECTDSTHPLVLTASTGTISSAYYPDNYVNSLNCAWTIQGSTSDVVIRLTFENFVTEDSSDRVCLYESDASGITCWSGTSLTAPTYRSTHNMMQVTFQTDSVWTYQGFSATYASEQGILGLYYT
jgi:hypothetical protein